MAIIVIIGIILQLLFYLAVIGLGIFIQAKLSKSENKYLGFILPVISFILASLITLGIASFATITSTVDGVTEVIDKMETIKVLLIFLVTNIPTIILSGIYYSERNKKKMKEELNKMRIEDL